MNTEDGRAKLRNMSNQRKQSSALGDHRHVVISPVIAVPPERRDGNA